MFRHIGSYIKEQKFKLLIGAFFILIIDILIIVIPTILGDLIDLVVQRKIVAEDIYYFSVSILIITIILYCCNFLKRKIVTSSATKIEISLRLKYYKKLQSMPRNFFMKYKTGDLMSRMTNDINDIVNLIDNGYTEVISSSFIILLTFYMVLTTIDFRSGIMALLPLPLILLVSAFFGKIIRDRFIELSKKLSSISEEIREDFSGIRIIKSFCKEDEVQCRFQVNNEKLYRSSLDFAVIWGISEPLVRFLSMLVIAIALYLGSNSILNDELTIGQFVAFISYLNILILPFIQLGSMFNKFHKGAASLHRINEILDIDAHRDVNLPRVNSLESLSIEFKDLSFSYADGLIPSLKHISFKADEFNKLGIIGRSGSGKSTLVNLIAKQEKAPKGSLYIGGVDINHIDDDFLKSKIAYMSQESFMFSRSIYDNISMGSSKITEEKVIKYCKMLNIHRDIMKLKDGYSTILEENGQNISLGQKQKIALARVLASEAEIIMFDDSIGISNLDEDKELVSMLKKTLKGRTRIVLSHRISIVKDASIILVLENGFLTAAGNHEQLVESNSYYRRLDELQRIEDKLTSAETS